MGRKSVSGKALLDDCAENNRADNGGNTVKTDFLQIICACAQICGCIKSGGLL